jgi:hypothetical protein
MAEMFPAHSGGAPLTFVPAAVAPRNAFTSHVILLAL